jgi:hypothetical protein
MTDATGSESAAPDRRPPLLGSTAPFVGAALAVLGLMLLVQQTYPVVTWPQTTFVFVTTILSASVWAVTLYVGTILVLVTMPLLLGVGVALLIAAVLRALDGRGFGWQAIVGAVLVVLGWNAVLQPPTGGPFVPVALVAIGAGLLSRRRGSAVTPLD